MPWSEDRLHRWLARRGRAPARALAGPRGDDAAVLRATPGRTVVCVDQTVEGVHFEPGTPPRRAGFKAAGRALSDLAASAARPRALLLALCAPPERDERWLREAIRAVERRGEELGAGLVGGDLCAAPGPASLAVTALGELAPGLRPLSRDRLRPGQVVLLTGPVGGSSLGRHLALEPRLDEGRWLAEHGARALMDVSDGLGLDLWRMARAAGVRVELERIPVHADARRLARRTGRAAAWHALHDGEDHELLAGMPAVAWRRVDARARRRWPRLEAVGRVVEGAGLWIGSEAGKALGSHSGVPMRWRPGEGGWLHGG